MSASRINPVISEDLTFYITYSVDIDSRFELNILASQSAFFTKVL